MSKKGWTIGIIVGVALVLLLCCGSILAAIAVASAAGNATPMTAGGSVAVIHLDGVIASSSQSGLLSGSATATPESLIGQLRAAEKDSRVAAIVLRIDSPGGSAAASQEIFEEVKRMNKPVVVSAADVDASGAYYISCAADEVMASRASSVGSIGVIMQIPDLQDLYNKLGIKYQTIKQGKYKDMGSGDRALTAEETAILNQEAKEVYDQFISDVAAARNLPEARVRELATGQVWNGSTAKGLGLIDSLGNYRDAVTRAGKLGKITGEPGIVTYDQVSLWNILFNPTSSSGLGTLNRLFNMMDRSALPAQNNIAK